MTVLHQLGLLASSIALMFGCVTTGAPGWCIYTLAYIGGYCVSQYDDGMTRRKAA